jgi:hypothetical protein
MIVVAFHSEMESYYLQEAPLLHKEVEDVLAEIQRRQTQGGIPTENIPSSSSISSMTKNDEDHRRNSAGSSSRSSNVDDGNVLSSPQRDHDIPF